jgi:hypothetical protein
MTMDIHGPGEMNDAFWTFHEGNPHVYFELVRLARQAVAAGRTKLGIRMLWERMRWTFSVETRRAEGGPKLNDHYTARYARLIMENERDLADLFEIRGARETWADC